MSYGGGSLDQVRRKLRRAHRYLDQLETELRAFDASPTWTIEDNGIFRAGALDPEWEITVGEIAVHALGALDQTVGQAVVSLGGDLDSHKGSFPIFDDPATYALQRDGKRYLAGLTSPTKAIIDSVQPFMNSAGHARDPLWVLKRLANNDKHRAATPGFAALRGSSIAVIDAMSKEVNVFSMSGPDGRQSEALGQLHDGDNPILLIPDDRLESIDGHIAAIEQRGGDWTTQIALRVGVSFGADAIFSFELRSFLSYVETDVVEPLAKLIEV